MERLLCRNESSPSVEAEPRAAELGRAESQRQDAAAVARLGSALVPLRRVAVLLGRQQEGPTQG